MDKKCFGENTMALGIGILVLHRLVSLSVVEDPAKLFCPNFDPHRSEGGTPEKYGFPT